MEQIILAILIIALGFYCFHYYPFEKGNIKKLVLAAIFVILTAICKRLAIMIPLFGTESFKVGFEYIPLMLAGYFLSPSYAFIVGLSSDLIGLILVPTGFPFLGFTLGTILVSVLPSLVKERVKALSLKTISLLTTGFVGCLGIGASVYIYFMDQISINKKLITLTMNYKMTLIVICLLLMLLFIVIIYILKKHINKEQSYLFSTWVLSVVLVEVICTLCLTPLWLNIMYGIPYFVSLCLRVIKECAILPIEIFIGYTLIQVLNRVIKY